MSFEQDRPTRARLRGASVTIAAAAIVFAALALGDALAPLPAIAGFAVLAAAALIGSRAGAVGRRLVPAVAPSALRTGDPLQSIISGLPDAIIALDRNGRVLALNERARALAPALRRGEPASLALRMPEVVDAIGRAAVSGEAQRVEYSERVPLDRWFETFVTPINEGGGAKPDLVLMTFHDLTPLRRVEEMRADFVANASHELRTPLAALSGFIETLQGPARDDAKARERFLAIMQEQARRMARLIDDLLSLSRIELNAHRRPDTAIDLVPIVHQVADGLETLARDRGVAVNVAPTAAPLMVLGDRDEMLRVFENLIENALKYGGAGKRVDITPALVNNADRGVEAQVAIRDYGPGIAPEHLPRLTERFYRVDVTESRAQGGTGLGLALVKHILNRHRGRLSIGSTMGEGATFTVHLPATGPVSALSHKSPIHQ
jgi:two-component system phosphate regulon sensor histidine kinase PhoR